MIKIKFSFNYCLAVKNYYYFGPDIILLQLRVFKKYCENMQHLLALAVIERLPTLILR